MRALPVMPQGVFRRSGGRLPPGTPGRSRTLRTPSSSSEDLCRSERRSPQPCFQRPAASRRCRSSEDRPRQGQSWQFRYASGSTQTSRAMCLAPCWRSWRSVEGLEGPSPLDVGYPCGSRHPGSRATQAAAEPIVPNTSGWHRNHSLMVVSSRFIAICKPPIVAV